ncbi:MAG: thermonuclease family protein [Alphaproteobacteria bacterium]|nr:thermonuclease family protein [Alphaproteobacteria bacterium]
MRRFYQQRRFKIRFLRLMAALVLIAVLSFAFPSAFEPQRLEGRVLRILDGDTVIFQPDNGVAVRLRLSNMDAPESDQPYGEESTQALKAMINHARITVQVEDIDRYGRTVGVIYHEGRDVCLEMVKQGMAWAYRDYLNDVTYLYHERLARHEKRGLWSLEKEQRRPPWNWRREQRKEREKIQQLSLRGGP